MKEIELASKTQSDFDQQLSIPHRSPNHKKYYVAFNRILHSRRCIYFYIFLIVSSFTIFSYSLLAYFFNLDELPILICESILIVVITLDVLIRIYVTGCRAYFSNLKNYLDICLILLNFFTIFMYLKFHNTAQEVEDISFALLISIRNSSQLLRLCVLIKNQQTISRNVEEIINFDILYEEKKYEILSIKKLKTSNAISFVDEEELKKQQPNKNGIILTTNEDFGIIE